jgi:hypothetical protein
MSLQRTETSNAGVSPLAKIVRPRKEDDDIIPPETGIEVEDKDLQGQKWKWREHDWTPEALVYYNDDHDIDGEQTSFQPTLV